DEPRVVETGEDLHACRGPLEYLFRWRGLGWRVDSNRESRLQLRLMMLPLSNACGGSDASASPRKWSPTGKTSPGRASPRLAP
ncbi:unnamed protein product, partial [Ectocarpus sp. 12 AP-2014]